MDIKLTDVDVRIVLACKASKRPIELLRQFGTDISYSYLCQRLSVLAVLGVLEKTNRRARGKNASWYTAKQEFILLAEKIFKGEDDESEDKKE